VALPVEAVRRHLAIQHLALLNQLAPLKNPRFKFNGLMLAMRWLGRLICREGRPV